MTECVQTPPAFLDHAGVRLRVVDLPALFGECLRQLPVVLRQLLENIVRNGAGAERARPGRIRRHQQRVFPDRRQLLKRELSREVSEQLLKIRYGLTSSQLAAVLTRISQEGWGERKPGYGWVFLSMLSTPDSLLQSYRLRLAIEPAALLEPGYKLAPEVYEQARAAELHLLNGGIETASASELHDRGVRYPESLVEGSGNPFFIDTIKRVNRVRRLLSYRSMENRDRYQEHCKQHLHVLELLKAERNEEAAQFLREHLVHTVNALSRIEDILKP